MTVCPIVLSSNPMPVLSPLPHTWCSHWGLSLELSNNGHLTSTPGYCHLTNYLCLKTLVSLVLPLGFWTISPLYLVFDFFIHSNWLLPFSGSSVFCRFCSWTDVPWLTGLMSSSEIIFYWSLLLSWSVLHLGSIQIHPSAQATRVQFPVWASHYQLSFKITHLSWYGKYPLISLNSCSFSCSYWAQARGPRGYGDPKNQHPVSPSAPGLSHERP